MNLIDLTGQKFGRLTVLERAENNKHNQTCWHCKCDCGNETIVAGGELKSGDTRSCGCLRGQNHGLSDNKTYNIWVNIKQRCFNPNNCAYKNYGGRGVTICDEWKDDFQAFYDYVSRLEHFGEAGYSLDRINNGGNYEPENVRWATAKEQQRNTRTNHIIEYNGEKTTLAEAAEKSGVQLATLWARIQRGDSGDRLFRPVRK